MDGLVIRRARPADTDAGATVMIDARRASVPAIPAPVHTDDEIRDWFRQVVMVRHDVWVAELGSRLVGVMVLSPGWIEHLYMAPTHTGAGIGSRLVCHAQGLADGGLDLWTFATNTGAARFYERHGFVQVGRTDGDNEEGAPDIRYRWTPHG